MRIGTLSSSNQTALLLWSTVVIVCTRTAWCHLSLFRMLSASELYSFNAREPFTYRLLLPTLLRPLSIDYATCTTKLNFPIDSCADLIAFGIDSASLIVACVALVATFRAIAASASLPITRPELAVPIFLWAVIFSYVCVPNSSIYYAYDFPELAFFAATAWLGAAAPARLQLLLPVLIFVASFNKETGLFMIPVFLVYAGCTLRLTRTALIAAALSVAAVLASKFLSYEYVVTILRPDLAAHTTVYENQIANNFRQLKNPMAWFAWIGVFGGAATVVAIPGPRVRLLDISITAILLGWLAVLLIVGLPREMRLFGPMIFLVLLPLMIKIEPLLAPRTPHEAQPSP